MIVIAASVIGALFGANTARIRKGNAADMAQYAAGYGIAFCLVGLLATIVIARLI